MSTTPLVRSCKLFAIVLAGMSQAIAFAGNAGRAKSEQIERGRYVVRLGGCNDCHTPGYSESGGLIPESKWLVGSPLGYQGPWGTTYPANLRSYFSRVGEDEWVTAARVMQSRPPMPSYTLHGISEPDLRAMHAFIASLGTVGVEAPRFVSPGMYAVTPVVVLSPVPPQDPVPRGGNDAPRKPTH
jgi:mono/diheme cytochrome c family protein